MSRVEGGKENRREGKAGRKSLSGKDGLI